VSPAQRQLLQRFRASATERLRRLGQQLASRARSEASAAPLLEVARELHTLKGESRMLGLRAVSSIVHRAENVLEQASHGQADQAGSMYERVSEALDLTARVLQDDPGSDADYAQALQGAQDALGQAEAALSAPAVASEPARPPARVSLPPRSPQPAAVETVAAPLPALASAAHQSSPSLAPVSPGSPAASGPGEPLSPAVPVSVNRQPAQRQERWVQVKADRIDTLCGTIAELSAGLRALRMQARQVVQGREDTGSHEPSHTFLAPLNSFDLGVGRGSTQPSTLDRAESSDARSLSTAGRQLIEDFERLQNVLDGIESAAWALRLVQIEPSLHDLAGHAKDLAQAGNKRVRVIVQAGSVEIERPVLDTVWEPLLHILRNAIDHGIESPEEREAQGKPAEATLTISAESAGPVVTLTVTDDGRGIAREDVRRAAILRGLLPANHPPLSEQQVFELLFQHGFSTRSAISELSGRGVGLDIVRSRVQRVGGSVSLSSQQGLGTQLFMKLPVRISKERGLVVSIAGTLFALPSRAIIEMQRLQDQDVRPVAGGRALWSRYGVVPLHSLAGTLGFAEPQDEPHALLVSLADHQLFAFSVARILGEYDLLRQPCDPLMTQIAPATASAVLDDGRLVLWLSAADVIRLAQERPQSREGSRPSPERARHRVLIVDDSAVIRALMAQVLATSGYDVTTAANGNEGLAALERSSFSAVLLDVDMPQLDGFGLLERLRPRWPSLPVAMFTSNTSQDHRQRASLLGANAYIVKSEFDEGLLVGTVARLIGGGR
jgi:two-component system, chemotaxis family, sensor kinase CheA